MADLSSFNQFFFNQFFPLYYNFYFDCENSKLNKFANLSAFPSFQKLPVNLVEFDFYYYYYDYYILIAKDMETYPSDLLFDYNTLLDPIFSSDDVSFYTILDFCVISFFSLSVFFIVISYFLTLHTSLFRYIVAIELLVSLFFFLFMMFGSFFSMPEHLLFALVILIVGAGETVIIFTLLIYRVALERQKFNLTSNNI